MMVSMKYPGIAAFVFAGVLGISVAAGAAVQQKPTQAPPPEAQKPSADQPPASQVKPAPASTQAPLPSDYVIGADDVLSVMFRRDKDLSADVVVRSDGKVTIQLLDDIQAAGLTPEQFRDKVIAGARRFLEGDPSVTVVVKQINSRKVFITGQVGRPGAYPIGNRLTVLQLISMAGGLSEFAKSKDIVIIRDPPAAQASRGAQPTTYRFNYQAVRSLKDLASNIDLKPGDTVIVP